MKWAAGLYCPPQLLTRTEQGHSSGGGLAGVAGAHLAAVSRGTGGCKAASPVPALAAAAYSHASLVLPAPSADDALPPSRLTPSVLSPSLPSAASRARGGCEGRLPVCYPGAVAAVGTRKQLTPSRDSESLTTIPTPRPTAVPAALTGTRSSPGLRRGGDGGSAPRLSPGKRAGSGRESAGRREAAAPDRLRRRRFWTAPAATARNGGREWERERGGDRRGHAQEMQEPKIFHHCSRLPAPIRRGTSLSPRSPPCGTGRDALRRLPAQPRGAEGRRRRTCFRGSGD